MKFIKRFLATVIILGIAVMGFLLIYKGDRSTITASSTLTQEELVDKGKYLATAGDCMACHTKTGEKPFSGGHAIESPIGAIAVTNITPDKIHGIGNMSLQDFDNAIRYGVRENGNSMYPAMPYPAFSILTDEDIEALYAYFMHGVEPVAKVDERGGIPWPLSMRWPLNGWRLVFAPTPTAFDHSLYSDEVVARGAYLTQGLGHCGTCHTPRHITLNEKAMSEFGGKAFLSGAKYPIEGWMATNLRGDNLDGLGRVSEEELAMFLKTGRNNRSAVFGGMKDVVNHSLQYLNDDDITAMARYIKTLEPFNPRGKEYRYDDSVAKALQSGNDSMRGGATYIDNCAACHRTDGEGYAQTFPALAGNPSLQIENPASSINLVLKGHSIDGTVSAPTPYAMPSLAWRLSNEEIADVVTFIRTSWGNQGSAVTTEEVEAYR